jgi:hypothetical protein
MNQLLFLLLILACPISMMFMMRGMHGGGGRDHSEHHAPQVIDTTAKDARIARLEREVDELRQAQREADPELSSPRR